MDFWVYMACAANAEAGVGDQNQVKNADIILKHSNSLIVYLENIYDYDQGRKGNQNQISLS